MIVQFVGGDVTVKHDVAKIVLLDGTDDEPAANDVMAFLLISGVWHQLWWKT